MKNRQTLDLLTLLLGPQLRKVSFWGQPGSELLKSHFSVFHNKCLGPQPVLMVLTTKPQQVFIVLLDILRCHKNFIWHTVVPVCQVGWHSLGNHAWEPVTSSPQNIKQTHLLVCFNNPLIKKEKISLKAIIWSFKRSKNVKTHWWNSNFSPSFHSSQTFLCQQSSYGLWHNSDKK